MKTVPGRRVQFPPLQFVGDSVRTVLKPHVTRSRVSKNVRSSGTASCTKVTCLQADCGDKVADSELCSEHMEREIQAETADDLQLSRRHGMTNADCADKCGDELTNCIPVCFKPQSCENDGNCDHLTGGKVLDMYDKDLVVPEQAAGFIVNEEQDLTVCGENVSAMHFDINTPTCEVESLDVCERPQQVVNELETETETCQQKISSFAGRLVDEPVCVLSFSHLDRSLDATQDPVERVICAAELNEDMSELIVRDEETSLNGSHLLHYRDIPEFLSTLNALTPLENRCKNTVLVSDTPVSDYDLSYRQRALKAGNIRLRHRTHKS